jgi:hypothetical protein
VLAARPAARAAHAFLELFAGAADAALAGGLLLGVFDPADELVAGQRGDVKPRGERVVAAAEALAQVGGELVDDATGQLLRLGRSAIPTRVSFRCSLSPV